MWNYIVEVAAGDDVAEAIAVKHDAHIARYPGVSQQHAIAATPTVRAAAQLAVAEAAKHPAGTPLRVEVAGPDLIVGEQSDDPAGDRYVPLTATATVVG